MALAAEQKLVLAVGLTVWAAFTLWIIAKGYLPF